MVIAREFIQLRPTMSGFSILTRPSPIVLYAWVTAGAKFAPFRSLWRNCVRQGDRRVQKQRHEVLTLLSA